MMPHSAVRWAELQRGAVLVAKETAMTAATSGTTPSLAERAAKWSAKVCGKLDDGRGKSAHRRIPHTATHDGDKPHHAYKPLL